MVSAGPVIGIDHIQLAMPEGREDEARGFYRDILGLPETPKPPDLAKRGGCWFETGAVKVHLGVDKNFHPAAKAHPGLLVSDLRMIIERCRERGVTIADDAPLDDAIDDAALSFYLKYQFMALESAPTNRLLLPMAIVRQLGL